MFVCVTQDYVRPGAFGGEGHRLGGNEHPMKFGDPQTMSKYVTDSGAVCV